ncbi:class I SAM-dependent methyltransferase [Pontibacter sp. CAU 1760]
MTQYPKCINCNSTKFNIVIDSNDYKILGCKGCSLGVTYPAPVLPDYAAMDFHSKDNDANDTMLTTFEQLPHDWKVLLKKQIGIINSNFEPSIKVLEIGCGEGILLNELQKEGYSNVTGIEPSKFAAARAAKRGLHVLNDMFENLDLKREYDLVILSHVLEHMPDPKKFISDLSKILKPSGGVLLTQTNYKGLFPSLKKANWYAWVPEQHYWHFTPKSLDLMFSEFTSQQTTYCSLVHPINFLYKFTFKVSKIIPSLQDQTISLYKLK